MPKSMNQKLKLLYIIDILKEKTDDLHGISRKELEQQLKLRGIEAERKSLYNDFDLLEQYGLDIVKERDGKEYKYYLASRTFELAELKLLVDAVQSSKFITEKKSRELIQKLEGLTSRKQAHKLQGQVMVAERIKNMDESIYYVVDGIHTAIAANHSITFQYFSWSANKKEVLRKDGALYHVSPWTLLWDDENYYLVGYDEESQMIRHYRVDRMKKVTVTDELRQGEESYRKANLSTYSRKMFSMFAGEEKRVEIKFSNELAGVVIDRFGKDVNFYKVDEQHFRINVNVDISQQFFGWIFGLGEQVEILSPGETRQEYKEYLMSQLHIYT